ncbi:MAG TPA: PTS system mannose/fructose/sorbose family transporter subunit IID [Candidatus Methanoperedens sp.]|nr:PTS system mannose/fructose/sorbose family transporter subunit IID [Candidatus Methanoperedens sp.]
MGGGVWSVFLRGLLVQVSWSFQRMQGAGFFLMVWPALRRRHAGDPAGLARAGVRSLQFFNTHPYFAGLVAATLLREEEEGRGGAQTDELARTLASALGSVGDEFFWAHLRPLAALAALPLALAGLGWAPLVLLALYNLPHLGVRWWGAAAGLARGRGVLTALQRRLLSRAVPALGLAIAVIAGFLVGALPAYTAWGLVPGALPRAVAAGVALFALLVALCARGLRPQHLLAGGVVAAFAAAGVALGVGQ